ncbi:MAG: sulfite exporter TauE/SafE family protein [Desulfobacca sp.]|uniref:sulfite exporter TauE/SafE family protein n=1 Tax=Desulfobacca sp. TaxID=2067990 RepID=UPI00404A7267
MELALPIASYWQTHLYPELATLAAPLLGWFYTMQPQGLLTVNLPVLILVGFVVGLLTGVYGVAGGFFLTPWLNLLFHVPYNVAVGTDLTQMIGTATMARVRQGGEGYVDYKLGLLMFCGSMVGVELGARLLELLKFSGVFSLGGWRLSYLQLIMSLIYGLLLAWIGSLVWREARAALQRQAAPMVAAMAPAGANRLRTVNLPPFISLPVSGVDSISLWVIIGVGFASGLLTGLLGVSGSFVRMPALIYVLGVPTVVSLGTNLFELLLTSVYGTLTHSLKGNVELVLVVILLLAGMVGSQLGAALQRRLAHPIWQLLFASLFFVTIALMVLKLCR